MKRFLAAAVLTTAALGAAPAAAEEPFGPCSPGRVDFACEWRGCHPQWGCNIFICVVWTGTQCL